MYVVVSYRTRTCTGTGTYVPVAEHGVQLEDDGLLVRGDLPPLEVRPEVVHPPQPAALPAPAQPCRAMPSSPIVSSNSGAAANTHSRAKTHTCHVMHQDHT